MDLVTALLVLVVCLLVYYEVKLRYGYLYRSVEKMFKGPQYLPFVGNALTFVGCDEITIHPTVQKLCAMYGRFTRIWLGHSVSIVISKPEDVEVLLSSTREITKSDDYAHLFEWIGTGLLTSTGTKWKTRRKIITPTFHFKILQDFLPIFDSKGQILLEKLSTKVGKGPFDVYNYIKLYTLDTISETALGVNINVQRETESKYLAAIRDISAVLSMKPFRPWLSNDFVFALTPYAKKYREALKILHETTEGIIKMRRESLSNIKGSFKDDVTDSAVGQKTRLAFLDLLILSEGMSDLDIREEVDTFMFEGHDTVTSGISFTLYALAHNQKIQENAYREQIEIFGDSDREMTVTDLQDMKYLEMVLKESQRLFPSVPIFGRLILDDLKLVDGYFLPKGCQCYVNVRKLHKDPSIWPNPEEFNPENFLPEASRNRNPYAYVPFSAGPRNCIGQRYAMMEMKSCLSKILRKFKLLPSKNKKDDAQITGQLVLFSANGINIEIENRK
ncbi:hypothetical protein RUM44_001924 [Polyplax serrata]|uniref:Cytochrome P450 n=1 Tax=Polyplax serrata TaxID=468196 RepID=A0ABR1AM43_POLSC